MTTKLYSVDLGYGYVKPLRQKPFPSVVHKTTASDFFNAQDSVESSNPFLISYNNSIYALGDTANTSTHNPSTIMDGNRRWESEVYIALMLGGILMQMPKGYVKEDIILSTGLPYLQSKNEEEINGLKETFKKEFTILTIEDGKQVCKVLNIKDVLVLSQPRAAYYALLPMTNKKIKEELALIADLGFKSLDYLVTSNGQETSESNGEDSVAGMERVYTSLIRELRSLGLPAVKLHEFDSWLSNNHLEKYSHIIDKSFETASKMIVNDMKEKLGSFWDRLTMIGSIYFVGGSSKRLQKYLVRELSGIRVYFADEPQQLIVEGYNAYGKAMMKQIGGDR